MKLLEYQAKKLLSEVGLPVPKGELVTEVGQVDAALQKLGIERGVAKAQAFTGGRGKGGGIKLFKSSDEAKSYAKDMLGMTLVTKQTGPAGTLIHSVYLEEASEIDVELYVALTLDRAKSCPVFILCPEGGMEIEEIAEETPEKILKLHAPLSTGVSDELLSQSAEFMGIPEKSQAQWGQVLKGLFDMFIKRDCSLLEINPLILTKSGELSILDCKFSIDDNALFRQKDSGGDPYAELTKSEIEAEQYGLNYIKLDGDIGCMVNGAGLAMATMDIIQHYGAEPANFLDVGGSASEEAVTKAFQIITSDPNVKGILVNIFGGIMECDKIAKGIVNAVSISGLSVPLVVRLSGTHSEEGKAIIDGSNLSLQSAETLSEGAEKIVAAVKGGK